jgi:hypothetical protein
MREIDIEDLAAGYIQKRWPGTKFIKLSSKTYGRGIPDRLVILPDNIELYIEFKRPGGRISIEQICKHGELSDRGLLTYFCESVEEALWACEQAILHSRSRKQNDPSKSDM